MNVITYLCAALIAFAPGLALACRLSDSFRPLTEQQKLDRADLVVIGTVSEMKDAPDIGREINHPYTFRLTMKVERWLKGSGKTSLELVDTAGTNCDDSIGISHIAMHPNPRSTRWRVFASSRQGRLWIDTAEMLK
jgi:hypothetical protein